MAKHTSRSHGYQKRRKQNREIRQRFLIVCEGEETEKNYFNNFRLYRLVIDIKGCGRNPTNLFRKVEDFDPKSYDQVWLVFDRDSWESQDIAFAIAQCQKHNYHYAYSNQCFELWYILHFEYLNTAIPRSDYIKKLTQKLGYNYKKNSTIIYDELLSYQATAIKNAERLLKSYRSLDPVNNDPSTTVHHLVQELNKHSH
jgi:hypothetical protein